MNIILDWSSPGLTATLISPADLQDTDGNWTTVGKRRRGGRCVYRQREKRKSERLGLRVGTLNIGTMTGKARVVWHDVKEEGGYSVCCETRWNGSKAGSLGAVFYCDVDGKRNGVVLILREDFVRNVLEVKILSDGVMSLKRKLET